MLGLPGEKASAGKGVGGMCVSLRQDQDNGWPLWYPPGPPLPTLLPTRRGREQWEVWRLGPTWRALAKAFF